MGGVSFRKAQIIDAQTLCDWWNDGNIMAHAGFPNGIGTIVADVEEQITNWGDDGFYIIELDGKPVGEMHYRDKGDKVADIGIKVCDFNLHGKGVGSSALTLLIHHIWDKGFEKIIVNCNTKNAAGNALYRKVGFIFTHTEENAWTDPAGVVHNL